LKHVCRGNQMIRNILVPSTGSDSDTTVFGSALAVARAFGAHLEFLHIRVDALSIGSIVSNEATSAKLIAELIERMEGEANQRERKAKQVFESFCQGEGLAISETPAGAPSVTAAWLREVGSEPYCVTEYARAADLLVIGRPSDVEETSFETLEAALLNAGRPILIPAATPIAGPPDTVVIAWKSTQEAARAVTAAMPFLSIAQHIEIITVVEDESGSEEAGAARLTANLRWHGFPVSLRHLQPDVNGAAETLLTAARERSALLVMGGYGHSRLREWIFGGFTRRVLRGAEVPVLIAH
jgi:nucleotide-binding universal stress UspA family protein